ncbi:phosphomannomutase [Rhizobium sp. Leaf384]|uniref:phosphomannomutase n=1 Tax=unclassified Rhizobium TaxID=2613769 RepID=UPI000715E671|nr:MULTISPECIES: phosphomannomutase [unclassified Rhizobium]KQS81229.1 phosphomannomutase [Rhizobium sp. Leaf384]KQS87138.1 phosphomannomutase [Rhizobium sp. Leaf383]
MSLKFGTSGLRGLAIDLEGPAAALYATAFAHMLLSTGQANPGDTVLIARDFRASSPAISAIAAGALLRAGLSVLDCGTVPTPALALYALTTRSAALMVTGSHIPADRNGIKFYRPDGEIAKDDELAITEAADRLRASAGTVDATPAEAPDIEATVRDLFVARNMALLPDRALAGLKVGVYQHSTVARDLFVDVLTRYGADVVPLRRSDSFIPVDTEAVSPETVVALRCWASEHGLDAIVSADGDGDRPLLSNERGEPIRGDLLGLIAAEFLGATIAVTPVTSNSGLERRGTVEVLRTRVGSPFVIAGMQDAVMSGHACVVGFEANGGTLTASDVTVNGTRLAALPTRDCFLPVLAALFQAAERRVALSAVVAGYDLPIALSDRLERFPVETSEALMTHLRHGPAELAAFLAPVGTPALVSDIDGLRITLQDGAILHLRPSGNAPEMRCYVEAATETKAKALLADGLALIRAFAHQRAETCSSATSAAE